MEFLKRTVLACVLFVAALEAQGGPASLGVAGRSNENVSLASSGRFVAAVWAASRPAGGVDVYVATSRDGGQSFSSPVRVNGAGAQADVGGEQPPQIGLVARAGGSPKVVVIWTAKSPAGTRVLTAASSDEGRTFSGASIVRGSDGPGNRGWESLATDASGRAYALWLDHRDMAKQGSSESEHHHADGASSASSSSVDGAARAQTSQLYFGVLDESTTARGVARGVCYCCRTALASSSSGIYAAWRHVYPGNRRDIAFTASRDGGRTFGQVVRVSEDGWQLDGCPENGPAIAVDGAQRVHVVWPTLVKSGGSSTLALFHAVTADGTSFTPRVKLPTIGAAYHPRLAVAGDGSLLVVWDEAGSGARRIRLARGTPDRAGTVSFRPLELSAPADGRYPAIAVTPTHAVLAWTSGQPPASRIQTVRVPLSQ